MWFLLLASEQVKDEGKATWCVCRYSREEKTSGAGKGKVKLQVSERGLGKAALSTLSYSPSLSWVIIYTFNLRSGKGTVHVGFLFPSIEQSSTPSQMPKLSG